MALPTYLSALGIGAAAGLRSMTAPAVVLNTGDGGLRWVSTVLAAGEFVADKLPAIPARTSLPSLAVRLLSGGWCGSLVAARRDASPFLGAGLGVLGAGATTWLFYKLRQALTTQRGWPDFPVALVEDALAVWVARASCAREAS